MTVLSVFVLQEHVGPRRWAAIVIGFIGVLIVVGPSGNIANLGAFLAFGCACAYAVSSILTRFIDQGDEPITIAIYSMLAFFTMSVILTILASNVSLEEITHPSMQFLFREWIRPDTKEMLLLFLFGCIATVGFYCLGRAYLVAPASHVAPFEYTYIVWAVMLSFLFSTRCQN